MRSVSIDQKSIEAVAAGQLDLESIVTDLHMPESNDRIISVEVEGHGFILSRQFQPADGLLTISLEASGPLTSLPRRTRQSTLARLMRAAGLIFTGRTRSIPMQWRPFHAANRIAFQADRRTRDEGKTDAGRVVMAVTQDTGPRIFAFLLDSTGTQHLSAFEPNLELLKAAHAHLISAIRLGTSAQRVDDAPEQLGQRIILDESMVGGGTPHISLDSWYNARLTASQRQFVDHPLSTSVRLVGPAGSGKTVALVVKCLRELRDAKQKSIPRKILFLTHASSSAAGIEDLVLEMDSVIGLEALASSPPSLVITTLYALADRYMRYDLDDLTPVSLDGHEGRAFQADVLNDVIEKELKSEWIAFRSRCSVPFATYMEAEKKSPERRFFLWELLNEFACVLDAEGVRSAVERREKYLADKRRGWMMHLENREEREVVLRLYDQFRAWLREMKAIGGDQMIADFLNYLDSYRWEATRKNEGFDLIFVDELHLFNRQERLLFRYLLPDTDVPPAVFMAYDAKQSPRDTFLGMPDTEAQKYDLWQDARLGKTEKIELIDVFRYTPEIVRALSIVDQSFPGQDLDSDWPAYSGIAKTDSGPIPILCELPSTSATYGVVFKRAKALQQKLPREARLAVLCCSYDLFRQYLDRPELRDDFYPITSRDEALGILPSRKKFLFSMPEYVAGLQYDTVLLIDVNRGEVPDGPYSVPALRKFASQVYLGASRAQRRLEIYASKEHGGVAPLLTLAIVKGAIQNVEANELGKKER